MLRMVYVSSAVRKMDEPDLVELLRKVTTKNASLEITGLLLYHDGNFIQVLEGPEPAVRQVFATIGRDPRHRQVTVLLEEVSRERLFPEWSMGLRHLGRLNPEDRAACSTYISQPLTPIVLEKDPQRAMMLLQVFRHSLR